MDTGMAILVESSIYPSPIATTMANRSAEDDGRNNAEDEAREELAKKVAKSACSLRSVGTYILAGIIAVVGIALIVVIVSDDDEDKHSVTITTPFGKGSIAPSVSATAPTQHPVVAPLLTPSSSSVFPAQTPTLRPTPSPTQDTTKFNEERRLKLNAETTYSKRGNRRTCGWDICPSFGYYWPIAKPEFDCVGGLDSCYLDGNDVDVEGFEEVSLLPVRNDGEEEIFKMVGAGPTLALGEGWDCASGSRCFDDPLRGGFAIDLTGTDYVFDASTNVTVTGWALVMQLDADGEVQATSSGAHGPVINHMLVPDGTKRLSVVCGGWSGGCTSELYVKRLA